MNGRNSDNFINKRMGNCHMGYRIVCTAVSGSLPFSDADSVSDYAQNALIWATQNGILNGYGDGRIGPKANAERAQVAAMMARFIQNAQ